MVDIDLLNDVEIVTYQDYHTHEDYVSTETNINNNTVVSIFVYFYNQFITDSSYKDINYNYNIYTKIINKVFSIISVIILITTLLLYN